LISSYTGDFHPLAIEVRVREIENGTIVETNERFAVFLSSTMGPGSIIVVEPVDGVPGWYVDINDFRRLYHESWLVLLAKLIKTKRKRHLAKGATLEEEFYE